MKYLLTGTNSPFSYQSAGIIVSCRSLSPFSTSTCARLVVREMKSSMTIISHSTLPQLLSIADLSLCICSHQTWRTSEPSNANSCSRKAQAHLHILAKLIVHLPPPPVRKIGPPGTVTFELLLLPPGPRPRLSPQYLNPPNHDHLEFRTFPNHKRTSHRRHQFKPTLHTRNDHCSRLIRHNE
jgi:hypothetical protein